MKDEETGKEFQPVEPAPDNREARIADIERRLAVLEREVEMLCQKPVWKPNY